MWLGITNENKQVAFYVASQEGCLFRQPNNLHSWLCMTATKRLLLEIPQPGSP